MPNCNKIAQSLFEINLQDSTDVTYTTEKVQHLVKKKIIKKFPNKTVTIKKVLCRDDYLILTYTRENKKEIAIDYEGNIVPIIFFQQIWNYDVRKPFYGIPEFNVAKCSDNEFMERYKKHKRDLEKKGTFNIMEDFCNYSMYQWIKRNLQNNTIYYFVLNFTVTPCTIQSVFLDWYQYQNTSYPVVYCTVLSNNKEYTIPWIHLSFFKDRFDIIKQKKDFDEKTDDNFDLNYNFKKGQQCEYFDSDFTYKPGTILKKMNNDNYLIYTYESKNKTKIVNKTSIRRIIEDFIPKQDTLIDKSIQTDLKTSTSLNAPKITITTPDDFNKGEIVKIINLQKNITYNNTLGTILEYDSKRNKYKVLLETVGFLIKIDQKHLKKVSIEF